jgi:hypothetical protein
MLVRVVMQRLAKVLLRQSLVLGAGSLCFGFAALAVLTNCCCPPLRLLLLCLLLLLLRLLSPPPFRDNIIDKHGVQTTEVWGWSHLVAGGFVEYVDTEEEETTLIAMTMKDLAMQREAVSVGV